MLSFTGFLKMLMESGEGRINFLKQKYADPNSISSDHDSLAQHRTSHDIISHFADHADPSKNKQFTQWIVQRYHEGNFRQEDAGRIKTALAGFAQHQSKLPHKDLNQYKTLRSVEDAVAPHTGTLSGKQEKKLIKAEGADLIHENEHSTIHHIKTEEAACQYGAGTKWCTAGRNDNRFDSYNKEGPLYVIQGKKDGRKYQYHAASNQFMDEEDEPENPHKISAQYGLKGAPVIEHTHVAFMQDHNLKNPEYLLQHQETIASTGEPHHIDALLDAAK